MSNAHFEFAKKGREKILHSFVENALVMGMEPAMVAQIADSSDPFVQKMISAPGTAQRRSPEVDFFAECTTNPDGTVDMRPILRMMEAQGAKKEVYRLACRLATKDRARALRKISPKIYQATAEVLGIELQDFILIYAEETGKAEGEWKTVKLISGYMGGEELSDLAEQYGKTEAEVVKILEEAGVYDAR